LHMNAALADSFPAPATRGGTRLFWVGLALQVLGLLGGLIGTNTGMIQAFRTLGSDSVGDPNELSSAISHVLVTTLIGYVVANLGVLLMTYAVINYRLCQRWVFWVGVVDGVLLAPVGLIMMVSCLNRFREFFPAEASERKI